MAMDGSFNLSCAVKRLLARCPKLQSFRNFDLLVKKEHMVKEEEVVNVLAEVFLHPNYTIPLMGCFRPIARKIVDKAVALLRIVPNLRSNADDILAEVEEEKVLNEVPSVIEYYNRAGRGLDLHELVCLAFCRALDLAPFLLGPILNYFKFAPPPFECILIKGKDSELGGKVGTRVLHAVRTSYRLLLADTEVFSKLWDWSCFMDLLKQSSNIDIRWCGTQILSVVLKTSCRATENLSICAEEAFTCLLRWDIFCQDTSLEKAGWYIEESSEHNNLASPSRNIDFNQENCLQSSGLSSLSISSQFCEAEPPIWSKRRATLDDKSGRNLFVLTSAVKRSFEMVVLAVSQKWPVLLYGPAGAGKSALISKLARDSGNRVLSINMDDQIDGKTLVGSYVCTEQPGEFRWQPGSLTQAVQNGFWVVFEDIDKAPSDVQSILLPLLEGASSFLTGHGEEIRVAESFRLFSTISTSKCDISREGGTLGVFWRKVMVGPPSYEDLQNIVKAWYPNLEPITEKLIETFGRVNSSPLHQLASFHSGNSASVNYLSRFSLRDLLKWCKRISGLGFSFTGYGLSAKDCKRIYQEAVDIFAAFSTSVENRLTVMKDIAKLWAVEASVAETLYPRDKPIIRKSSTDLTIGRVDLPICRVELQRTQRALRSQQKPFAEIRSSVHVLERIACSVMFNEPVLLVGETGTGKTTLVQHLAMKLGQKLTVLNLSQQSDVADLLGGFKPMNAQFICFPLYKEFEDLFSHAFNTEDNVDFLTCLQKYLIDKNWKMLVLGFQKGVDFFRKSVQGGRPGSGKKRKKPLDEEKIKAWEEFALKLESVRGQIGGSSGMVFSFVEGAFVTALRNGEWILLDEVNLAPPETLQRVNGVLEGDNGSLCLAERGDVNYIHRHPNFRVFSCMNPATDAGKRDLPFSLRSRFTEYFVDDVLDDKDLILFIDEVMDGSKSNPELVDKIVCFYKAAKKVSEERLQDGANQKPQYSLRSLYRSLEYTRRAERKFGLQKAIYDGFCMFFLTLLDRPSAKIMNQMILSYLLGGNMPAHVPFHDYLTFKENSTYTKKNENSKSDDFLESYVLTKSVREHLSNLARAILIKKYPVLLQGPTSSGKTSLVQYLAAKTGREFVRINNHEHTDLQEYLGSYITDASGKLVFHEGVLVKAVRNGYWIVLDELNLAPSDVLEALNRLLDDNRELFVPELQETVRAHSDFMLFATQNPPTFYGGRKMLSRAFRNRFVEIHVDEIPEDELSTILEKRCKVPESYAKKMVEVMKELQLLRQSSKVFAGKHGFITPRDLFRWADRFRSFGCSYEDLARDGYYLLAERLRVEDEKCVVEEVLEKHLRVKLVKDHFYKEPAGGNSSFNPCDGEGVLQGFENVIWTKSMWRLYFLVKRCYELREPVLLVGETGGGKTTVCQLLSIHLGLKLHILNCHQYTETSDFLGGFYPIRERSRLTSKFKEKIEQVMLSEAFIHYPWDFTISSDIGQASSTLDQLTKMITNYKQGVVSCSDVTVEDVVILEKLIAKVSKLHQKWQTIFIWQDGPLVQAMKNGDLFLVDEISLADDSVLERLNSVLEPERKLSLAEKGGSVLEKITAHPNFFVLATMNPGGDYGKKELSPALRNRFTEIWVPPVSDQNELKSIALQRFSNPDLAHIVDAMLSFWEWFNQLQPGRTLTVRDLLSWVAFINATERSLGPECAFLHGAFLVLLDGLSLGTGISKWDAGELRKRCLSFLSEKLKVVDTPLSRIENYGWVDPGTTADNSCSVNMECDNIFNMECDNIFGIDPFYIEKGCESCEVGGFEFSAPTTCRNALRVLRAMQLPKPVLLEGSPGVGKTSLVVALGKFSGHRVVRINLSEQTDIMDLLGSDLPVESDEGMKFAWSDGILLQALKEGCWVLLDELNLAPQSVLEGLNAILDHRAEVFIPELGLTFKCPSSFRVFACQNPSYQGGGRKGLPKSFLNRFTKVYVDELVEEDYLFICSSLYKSISEPLLSKLISFNKILHEDTMLYHKFAQDGSPWEFNLRDVIRSCQIIQGAPENLRDYCFLNIVYIQRMRTAADRREVLRIYEQVFEVKPLINPYPRVQLNSQYLVVGNSAIKRNYVQSSKILGSNLKIMPGIRQSLEATAHCVQHQWMCILIGPSSCGKTSLIRLLAQLTGNVLNELNLSSATDISELLGCFEQYNAFRNFRAVVDQVECYVNEYYSLQLESSKEAFISERKDLLITRWLAFLSSLDFDFVSSSTSLYVEHWKRIVNSVNLLVEIIEQLKLDQKKNVLPVSWSSKDLDRAEKIILKLQQGHQKRPFSAKFEWVMGTLIKAIERGEWIVLENANLCNPTVLDRINSLVESSGSITINECGIVDGKPVVLHPHTNFRMFLTVNPSYGEVSRAMRNRGVEIFMMQPNWLLDEGSGYSSEQIELKEVERFLILSGVPGSKLVSSMAKSHVYARDEGLHLNICITYLELARWVQLFQQLLTNGNQPMWSLQVSWEHTYLSSFGEAEGEKIICHAKSVYLSVVELSDSLLAWSLCLPGGWPMPLKLRDFIWYSKEACVKQNCMYLEFLGAQCASYELEIARTRCPVDDALTASGTHLMNVRKLHHIMFPKSSNVMVSSFERKTEFDLALANKMLLFAASWTIEQATQSDLELYLLWFRWFSTRLQPFCQFFNSFLSLIKQVMEHPIWNYISCRHHEFASFHRVDFDLQPIPMLSLELVDFTASSDFSKPCGKFLRNAINCLGPLKVSYQQWNAESSHEYNDEAQYFIPVLKSLRVMEEEILQKFVDPSHMFVESPCFDTLIQLYTDLIEDHGLFWNGVTSSNVELLLISWRSLMKGTAKLKEVCPKAVDILLRERRNLENWAKVSSWHLHSEKSLIWVHGGHPFLPSSANLYHRQHQLSLLCELLWPTKSKSWEHVNRSLIEVVASSNPELRFLAMEGVSMSLHIMKKFDHDEDDVDVVQQLEEMYKMLLERHEYEKHKLEANLGSTEHSNSEENSAACCIFHPQILCKKAGFDSWQDTLPLTDCTSFFLDMELLQKLSSILFIDPKGLQMALGTISNLLESALKFSLTFSSRHPQMFLPHKKILWALRHIDARSSVDAGQCNSALSSVDAVQCNSALSTVDAVHAKIASFVLEMWFRWHQSLWIHRPVSIKNFSKIGDYDIPLPDMVVQPVNTAMVFKILQSTGAIREYFVHGLKLRVASCNLWHSSPTGDKICSFLLSAARSLFQQIIYAHKKSFDAKEFSTIKSNLCAFQKNTVKQENVEQTISLILLSSHRRLKASVHKFIDPLLRELYLHWKSTDYILGCAWFRIGGLRFHLLLSCDDLDPAVKYHLKYSKLVEKITSLKLEMQVRQECDFLAGWLSTREADNRRVQTLRNLEVELRRVQRKTVFRSDPGKFKKLKRECNEFLEQYDESLKLVTSLEVMMSNIDAMDIPRIVDQFCNWQDTATCFIDRLSDEYAAYIDVVQPVQVAVYEMKMGLSLVLSSVFRKEFLCRVEPNNMDLVMGTIYSLMRFPRGSLSKSISVHLNTRLPELPSYDLDIPTNFCAADLGLLEKLVTFSSDVSAEKMVSVMQLKAALHHNIFVRVAHSVADAQLMDNASFMLLDKIFNDFANLWMSMKDQEKTKEDYGSQQYRFRSRAFEIESIIEVDISTLGKSFSSDSFSEWKEWKEKLSEDDITATKGAHKDQETSEDEQDVIEESILNNMVHVHNQLFGSSNLVLAPGTFQISDADRLLSFTDSYRLGVGMIKGLGSVFFSSLDAKLMPEHLLRLCLEHEQTIVSSRRSDCKYNFYKDSNAPLMAEMVKLLTPLQSQILSLLNEWEDHHGLQKILDVIEMLLDIPLNTPLAKALSGLQFLLIKAQPFEEKGSKFKLSDHQLKPIRALVSSWKKMEFGSWPALLDEVQDQYEINAGKLWFPLYSVLQHRHSADIIGYNLSTIQSLEDFIHTSSIGEFSKRLQLLFAFLGQFNTGRCLQIYSSPPEMNNLEILYNVFGFYVQFLPTVLEHIKVNRRNIEMELKELLKLCEWKSSESLQSIENSKSTRRNLRKLIKKYTDLLQQPVMLFLNQAQQKGAKAQPLHGEKILNEFSDNKVGTLNAPFDLTLFSDEERSIWYAGWRKNVDCALQKLHPETASEFVEEVVGTFRRCSASHSTCVLYQEQWKSLWCTIEDVYRTAVHCDDLWKDTNKSVGKRRALSELLKLLENSGLSRHKSIYMEDQLKSWWFLKPSYYVQNLLLTQSRMVSGASDSAAPTEIRSLTHESSETEWKTANEYYFKSIASVLLLRQICLNSHKDITREQVDRSGSFLNQLIDIQQKQQAAANDFAEQLKHLRECVSSLENYQTTDSKTVSECSIVRNQHATFKCMWQQKQLFDGLCAMLREESLLLRTFENTHSTTCQGVKAAANRVLAFVENFFPDFQKSKGKLDCYLLGCNRAITTLAGSSHCYVITRQMEDLVFQNFQAIKEFEEHLFSFRKQEVDRSSVKEVLLSHFEEVFTKGRLMEEEFNSARSVNTHGEGICCCKYIELKAGFDEALKSTLEQTTVALQKLGSSSYGSTLPEESLGNITSWEFLFKSFVTDLKLDLVCEKLLETICCAEKLAKHSGFQIGVQFKHLHVLLSLLLNFGDGLLQDLLAMYRTVSTMTHVLANVLASLFSKGFGIPAEDQLDDNSQDASGTGMGEGAGKTDVSDQITDEEQLLGTLEKASDEQDASNEVPSKDDKGIEMEQDFEADTYSVSEDSAEEDNNEDTDSEQIESAMGDAGDNKEAVDEKLWNKDEDENHGDKNEKYESGSSVKDRDTSSRELRAKEEEDNASPADEPGDLNSDERNDEIGSEENVGDGENTQDMNLDKEEAVADPTGLELDESNQCSEENMDLNENEGPDAVEELGPEEHDESDGSGNHEEENTSPTDDTIEEAETEQVGGTSEKDDVDEENVEMNLTAPSNNMFKPGTSDFTTDHVPNGDSATQPQGDSQASDSRNIAPESNWSSGNDAHNDLAPLRGLPSTNNTEMDIAMADSSNSGRYTDDQPKSQLPLNESSSIQKTQPNPYRNVGDALKEWKERVKVSVDLQADNIEEKGDEIEDENADEYGYVSEFEKGTAQALGPATSEQVDRNVNGNKQDGESLTADRDDIAEMETETTEKQNSKEPPLKSCVSILKNKMEEHMNVSGFENSPDEGSQEVPSQGDRDSRSLSESLVTVKKSYLSEGIHQFSKLSVIDDELGKAQDPGEVSDDVNNDATSRWRRYELLTTRLSQELAEQLRLVMEPTLASKLQGDYKTGKRINMKKVIPYIASHYRKDKIWMRRTKPNKRDYQVVIAVDDSSSMSESRCENFAIEALVTVCRAMSQLEMGSLAVASYGKKGNIKLLHDFDQTFTGEAGVKMISSLTFEQENTIADEPVVDLLKYLNNMLDVAVANARLPSGQNPLQQLVLVIADGRLHEKENLKRCVRDVLSKKRMVAFIILDSPQDSIMDLPEACFEGGNFKFLSKYLDSFPFPYYIVLKNIEALPRTLSDLLRQWFELMQNSRD